MPTHIVGVAEEATFEAEEGVSLATAIEAAGIDISHRCGGQAKCTTCNVRFLSEEPPMGEKEHASLSEDGVLGEFRLACQIPVDREIEVEVLTRASVKGWEPGQPIPRTPNGL